ncbi:glutathione S-transferase family protein [Neptunomonas japonica]|uniref:Glutathione S-transferase n=1 Tax=Neptunomonas japonica JAMM 1380 TaxID=1441457 RepID=A0A7R6PI05_9GAMM|nr:glutathione S-transferase family protein [Neptunomonas japonica]BBB30562.1 glutathione S-transferase [Neptunomonas japonica JAMM 1380]
MKPVLYGAPLSPFVRKVRLLLDFKEVDYDSKMIVPYATPKGYEALNPLKKVPALVLGDNVLADSAVIAHFLDAYYPEKKLVPDDLLLKARCEWLEKYADYELSPHTTFTVFSQRILNCIAGKQPNEELVQKAIHEKLPPLFDYLESQLNGLYFIADELTLADISVASQLISYEHANETVPEDRWPKLTQFYQHFKQQTIVEQVISSEKATLTKILDV